MTTHSICTTLSVAFVSSFYSTSRTSLVWRAHSHIIQLIVNVHTWLSACPHSHTPAHAVCCNSSVFALVWHDNAERDLLLVALFPIFACCTNRDKHRPGFFSLSPLIWLNINPWNDCAPSPVQCDKVTLDTEYKLSLQCSCDRTIGCARQQDTDHLFCSVCEIFTLWLSVSVCVRERAREKERAYWCIRKGGNAWVVNDNKLKGGRNGIA